MALLGSLRWRPEHLSLSQLCLNGYIHVEPQNSRTASSQILAYDTTYQHWSQYGPVPTIVRLDNKISADLEKFSSVEFHPYPMQKKCLLLQSRIFEGNNKIQPGRGIFVSRPRLARFRILAQYNYCTIPLTAPVINTERMVVVMLPTLGGVVNLIVARRALLRTPNSLSAAAMFVATSGNR